MIFDTHAHYTDGRFDEDRDDLLRSMAEHGIGQIVEIGASVQSTKDAVALADQYDFIYASVGVHPEDIARLTEEDMTWLAELTKRERVVAVGEIGLDYHYDEPPQDLQKKWFIRQLQVAAQTGMPVLIHSREAAKDTLDIMEEHCAWENGGVIHCFSYSWEIAQKYLEKGFYLGIGGVVTFKNSKKLKEVVEKAPLERIVLETDAPYLAPEPYRGKRNDSSYLTYVVDVVAELKQLEREEVIRVTEENAKKLYRL
ncbi:MAG: TatD family hydrolase [Lachnospiraceae bacterium]|nr:TatD family hydrolase [Lachnospiraceae bacterium]